jgi:hypothetical protein
MIATLGDTNHMSGTSRQHRRVTVPATAHEKTIMKIGVWKTRPVFDRYNLVDEDEKDLADAVAKLDRKAQRRKRRSSGTGSSRNSCE